MSQGKIKWKATGKVGRRNVCNCKLERKRRRTKKLSTETAEVEVLYVSKWTSSQTENSGTKPEKNRV